MWLTVSDGRVQANNVMVEVMQGDAKNILCEVVEKHQASMLVVGSHGYGAIKRYIIHPNPLL